MGACVQLAYVDAYVCVCVWRCVCVEADLVYINEENDVVSEATGWPRYCVTIKSTLKQTKDTDIPESVHGRHADDKCEHVINKRV